jgi:hypothetical protein
MGLRLPREDWRSERQMREAPGGDAGLSELGHTLGEVLISQAHREVCSREKENSAHSNPAHSNS